MILLVAAWFALSPGAALHADEDPRGWLERLNHALSTLSYEGTVVHTLGGSAAVLHLVHRVEGGRVTERVTAQSDASGREMIRDGRGQTWIFPDRQTVLVAGRETGGEAGTGLTVQLPRYVSAPAQYYDVALTRDGNSAGRLAGREVQALAIRPRDGWRYGYRLWLDRATAVPLKTQLISEQGVLIEQLVFTSIALAGRIPRSAVRPSQVAGSFARHSLNTASQPVATPPQDGWMARRVPPGFTLTAVSAERAEDDGLGLRHLVYTDGVATISVFVDVAVAAAEQAEGLSRVGAANVYTTTLDGHLVTALGEAPARTVELIATSSGPAAVPRRR